MTPSPPATADRLAVAAALREIGLLLEVKGGNPYRARAYKRGASAVEALAADLTKLVAEDRLTQVPGIGAALAAQIAELHRTGRSSMLERLRAELPPGILDLVRVPNLSVERVAALHRALGIRSVAELKAAAEAGRVREVKGFGEKTEKKILDGIAELEARGQTLLLHEALQMGELLRAWVAASPHALRVDVAGEARRRTETVDQIQLAVAARDAEAVVDHFLALPQVAAVVERGDGRGHVRLAGGVHASVEAVAPSEHVPTLVRLTGSSAHYEKLQARAQAADLVLSERALMTRRGRRAAALADEAALYRRLGLQYVPPELREDEGEVEAAAAGTLPEDLLEESDVRGLVHCHTHYSDGKHSVEEMARGADELGMEYITITDHSPTAHYAGGLSEDRLKQQWEDIDRAQEKVKVRLLRGTESDILADGALDYPDRILEQLDVVVASIHNRYKMGEDEMTRRLVRAMRLPLFKIWGHALGRYVRTRPPIACRVEEVLDAAAASKAAIEISGEPRRLDMEPRWVRKARERGLRFVISTDAHSVRALQNFRYGVAMARRGWVRKGEVLNALGAEAFREAVRPVQ
ncbi:MAG: DNA polymerase/3'-5' exonuclease PolX [Acidobacteria bacterium]|nr:MAG: DNA polymerase/3'-5' exonuclease PolX [Acidobacteriota bacterium]